MTSKLMDRPPPGQDVYWFKVHGGLGDILWLYYKLSNLDKPLFFSVSSEGRTRPRRSNAMLDHMPRVVGYRFDDSPFCPDGRDWTKPGDPACAIDRTWADLRMPVNKPYRLECNRHLESGRRLETWLPDVPTNFHPEFTPEGPPSIKFDKPAVVLHLAGWPDVPDQVWLQIGTILRTVAHVYVVGGSYDRRPRAIYSALAKDSHRNLTLMEDVSWADLVGSIKNADYVFGHASGYTALADTFGAKGVVFNPHTVARLIGTWNSPDNPEFVQVDRVADFRAAAKSAYDVLAASAGATWPPQSTRGGKIAAGCGDSAAEAAVRAAVSSILPRHTAFVFGDQSAPPDLPAWALSETYTAGQLPRSMLIVNPVMQAVDSVYKEASRSTKRPVVDVVAELEDANEKFGFDLGVVVTDNNPSRALTAIRWLWQRTTNNGTVLVGGPSAAVATRAMAATLKTRPAEVENAEGWFYLHRRL